MKKTIFLILLVSFFLSGCGETITGAAKDVKRVGKGIKTIFFKDSN